MTRFTLLLTLIGLSFSSAVSQTYSLDQTNSNLTVLGTSTLHDWEITAEDMNGSASIDTENNLVIEELSFKLNVKGLKSGKNSMDKNTWEALKSEKYPHITYELKEIKKSEQTGKSHKLTTSGILTIAGYSKSVEMPVMTTVGKEEVIFSGQLTFNMTDYKVDPPTALMGTIKTGDEVTVKFSVNYKN